MTTTTTAQSTALVYGIWFADGRDTLMHSGWHDTATEALTIAATTVGKTLEQALTDPKAETQAVGPDSAGRILIGYTIYRYDLATDEDDETYQRLNGGLTVDPNL